MTVMPGIKVKMMFVEYCGQVCGSFPTKAFMTLTGIAEMPTLPSALSAGDMSCSFHAYVVFRLCPNVLSLGSCGPAWDLCSFGLSQSSSGCARALLWVDILHETQMTQMTKMTQISKTNKPSLNDVSAVHVNHSHFQQMLSLQAAIAPLTDWHTLELRAVARAVAKRPHHSTQSRFVDIMCIKD